MPMSESLERLMYDDVFGVAARFRYSRYDLDADEVSAIRGYLDDVVAQAERDGCIGAEDFRDFVGIIEVLERAEAGPAILLSNHAYDRVLHIGA